MELRKKGYGYKRIAKELDMTVSAVRYAITKYEEDEVLSGVCKHCGQETMSIKGRKRKVFCSDKCRWAWWNNNKEHVNKQAYYKHVCKNCGTEFKAYGAKHRIYCGQKCYIESKTNKNGDTHAEK